VPHINGTGKVVSQQPTAGSLAEPGAAIHLILEPAS